MKAAILSRNIALLHACLQSGKAYCFKTSIWIIKFYTLYMQIFKTPTVND